MKKLYFILLVFVINSIVCFSSEQIELSSRLGNTISLDSRNYFGLFPDVKDFKSAVLFKDVSINYFEITAGKSEEKSKIILSDSAVSTLAYVIDNFEGIISESAKYKLNGKLISGLIRISTQFNKKAKPVKIKLRDSTEFSGFILYTDSSVVVTTQDSAYRAISADLKITGYSDIYSISNVDYPIIDRTKEIFVINKESFLKLSLFKNVSGIKVTPPEVLNLIKEQPIQKQQSFYESPLDFDSLYFKRMMVSADYSFQAFEFKENQLKWLNDSYSKPVMFTFYHSNSFGLNFDYKISKILRTQIGYNYEILKYTFTDGRIISNFLGNAVNINLFYTFWHSKTALYMSNQIFADIYGGLQLIKYRYGVNLEGEHIHIYDDDITTKIRQNYKAGINIRYKISYINYIYLKGYIDYHNDYGFANFQHYNSKHIDYFFGYGISAGFGFEL